MACIADALGLEGAERFFLFCKALEAKYGRPFVFGANHREQANRVYEAVSIALDYGRRVLRLLTRPFRRIGRA